MDCLQKRLELLLSPGVHLPGAVTFGARRVGGVERVAWS